MAKPTEQISRLGDYNASSADVPHTMIGPDGYGYVDELPRATSDLAVVANWLAEEVVDVATAGVRWAPETILVRAVGNVNIASGLVNGASLNGVTLATGDHVFLPSQADPKQNGIYTVVSSGAASRASFANSSDELSRIGFVIQSGAVGAGERWTCSLDVDEISIGVTNILFSNIGTEVTAETVPWAPSGAPAASRSVQSKLRERVSVLDFRLPGDANWTVTFTRAIDYLQSIGGGNLKIPAGTYDMGGQLEINPIAGIGWNNVVLHGDGRECTILDFDNAGPTDDGIAIFGWGGRFGIKDLSVINAPAIGINVNKGESAGGASHLSRWFLDEVIVDGCGSDGVRIVNAYMLKLSGVESRNNGGKGFALLGFITSLQADRCWAGGDAALPDGGNTGIGWDINGAVYSTFKNCSADWNGGPGWRIRNVASVSLLQCASENNGQEGVLLATSTASATGIPAVAQDIKGLILEGFFALNNSRLGANSYANFLGAVTANSRPIDLELRGCRDDNSLGTSLSLRLDGASGSIRLHEQLNFLNGSYSLSGTSFRQNDGVAGRRALARLGSDQSVTDSSVSGTEYRAAFATLPSNDLGCSITTNEIVLPAGVSTVRCVAGAFWGDNSSGIRMMRITKNGSAVDGAPQGKVNGIGFTPQSIATGTIAVNPAGGDKIGLLVLHTSGGSLSLINNGSTFLEVAAVG